MCVHFDMHVFGQGTISDVIRGLHFVRGKVSVVGSCAACSGLAGAVVLQLAGVIPSLPPVLQWEH